jgi:Calcineurin-like phosphoesterase
MSHERPSSSCWEIASTMSRTHALLGGLFALGVGALASSCATSGEITNNGHHVVGDDTGIGLGDDSALPSDGGVCSPCTTDADCQAGSSCAQIAGDTYCVPRCATDGSCADGTCTIVSDFAGNQASVCAPSSGLCAVAPSGGPDAGPTTSPASDSGVTSPAADAGSGGSCGTLIAPTSPAPCTSCKLGSKLCQTNGCFGGWWCDSATDKCHAPPTGCSASGGDAGTTPPPPIDAGPVPTGSVSAAGGKVSSLFFAIVGDSRPPLDNDTSAYPTAIVTSIYKQISTLSPQFVVSTGDYMFASPSSGQSSAQLDLYLSARKAYAGVLFPGFGNHECTGQTTSNCGPSGTDGLTTNYNDFVSKMLTPIGQSKPYYSIRVDSSAGSWTAKFVFVAANAWDSAQSSWLDTTLATPTTYTFVIRHEPAAATTAPGTSPSEAIMRKYPYTLAITGHTHLYAYHSPKEVVFGNGGAPLTGSGGYGFGVVTQRADGAIQVAEHDYATGAIDSSFTFALKADGTPTP